MRANWQTGKLGDFFEIVTGGTPSKARKEMYGSYMPLVKPPELTGAGVQSSEDFLSEEGAAASRILPAGSVLVSCIGNLGKVGVSKVELATNQQINSIKPNASKALPEFIFYLVQAPNFIDQLQELASGTTVPIVNKSKFKSIIVSLPPLPEQKRIVAILDEAFAGIDAAIANTEKNLANAQELFESELEKLVAGAIKKSGVVSLSELALDITDGDHMPPPKSDSGVPFITIKNIEKSTRKIDFSSTFKVSEQYFLSLKENRKPRTGDVLYTVTGSYGIPVLVGKNDRFCFQRHIGLIRPKPKILPEWLEIVLLSKYLRKQADEGATGTAQQTVSLKLLRSLKMPNQAESEQRLLVERGMSLSSETKKLENIYAQKLTALSGLKQSLLQKAFSGELTAQIKPLKEEAIA